MIEYDVFLSFSSKDIAYVRPIWQQLSSSGLRVFWSDDNLKKKVGQSFFKVIQGALAGSQHFVLVCNQGSILSEWVQLEYETFFSHYHLKNPNYRRFIILKGANFELDSLPPFLRNLQIASDVEEFLSQIGGVNVQKLLVDNEQLSRDLKAAQADIALVEVYKKSAESAQIRNDRLKNELSTLSEKLPSLESEIGDLIETVDCLRSENRALKSTIKGENTNLQKIESLEMEINKLNAQIDKFEIVAQSAKASSETLTRNYNSLLLTVDDKNQEIRDLKRRSEATDLIEKMEQQKETIVSLSIEYDMLKTDFDRATNNVKSLKHHLRAFISDSFTKESLRDALEKYIKKQGSKGSEIEELLKLLG